MDELLRIDLVTPSIYFDSIKLSGALIDAFSKIFGKIETDEMLNSNDFMLKVTDPFPYFYNKPLFPLPSLAFSFDSNSSLREKREIMFSRKAHQNFIPLETLKNLGKNIHSGNFTMNTFENIMKNSDTNPFTDHYKEIETLGLKEIVIPGLNLSDENNGVFSKHAMQIVEGYLWIGVKSNNTDFISCFHLLQKTGISGKSSTGFGVFSIKAVQKGFNEGYTGDGLYLNLMPFIPSEKDMRYIDLKKSYIKIENFCGTGKNGKDLGVIKYISSGSLLYLKGEVTGVIHSPFTERILNFSGYFVRIDQ
ncbi:MAG: hypothetical protein ACYCUZ_00150 [Cuniculiplasma sp.]